MTNEDILNIVREFKDSTNVSIRTDEKFIQAEDLTHDFELNNIKDNSKFIFSVKVTDIKSAAIIAALTIEQDVFEVLNSFDNNLNPDNLFLHYLKANT
ncbi:MAG: hypothetical protein DI539_13885 [Flavobacterium psychrophilum]|nr:MAG: hypothetical protein DI539_13885 [Flavobacterium psychrophilum]